MPNASGRPSRQEKLAHLDAALSYVTRWRFSVDAGAHVGNWTVVMASRFERVLAFEPMLDNQERWREKMAGITNAQLVCKALGDRACVVRMDGSRHAKHYATPDPAGDVAMVTIDSLSLPDLDFLKVDCEGADTLVLRGAEATIKRCRPVIIVESLAKFERRYGLPPGAPIAYLQSLGMRHVGTFWCDYIFVFPDP